MSSSQSPCPARAKEWQKLIIASGAIRVLGKESELIREDMRLKNRILKSRFVIAKAGELPLRDDTELKARWCTRGFLDPDLLRLDTEHQH